MKAKIGFSLALVLLSVGALPAVTIEVETTAADGSVTTRAVAAAECEGVVSFRMSRAEILSAKAKRIAVTPDFMRAKKGDAGFWVFSSGEYGTFRADAGTAACHRWQLMSCYGMQNPSGTYAAIVKGLKYYFKTEVAATNGAYRMSCVLEGPLVSAPYEDFEIEFRRLVGDEATLGGIARAYRRYQFDRGACRPLAERVKANPVLKRAVEAPEVRVRLGWKPVPTRQPHQVEENEPPVKPVVTFDRVADIARAFRRQGVGDAEFCLVGWNVGGHDGRWPQMLPAERVLGGTQGLLRAIKSVQGEGYLIVPHGNFRDGYLISDSWDGEWVAKDAAGEFVWECDRWGGGREYLVCPQRAWERFVFKDMRRLAALGFRGLGYFDVASIVHATECADPRHPVNAADGVRYWGKCAALAQAEFGGFASEGAFDHFVGALDSALYVTFNDPRSYPKGLVDRMAPFPQLVYNGVFTMNPFTRTVNFTAQEKYWQLKLVEFGGRPNFYVYSKFVDDGTNWMGDGDLGCATDAELAASAAKVKAGADVYSRLSHLQYVFMREHEEIAPGVWRTRYENGESVVCDYNSLTWRLQENQENE